MTVKDFMTANPMTVMPEDSLMHAAQIMYEHNFEGLPVATEHRKVMGIITQYDLVSKGANLHLPTFLQLMKDFPMYQKDKSTLKPELEKIVSLTVKDLMNPDPLTVKGSQTLEEAAQLFTEHHRVNPIIVVDEVGRLEGVISRYDIIRFFTGSAAAATTLTHETSADKKVDLFVKAFEKNFVVVSKFRTHFWFAASLSFAIIGFLIAMFWLIRIELNN